MYAGSTLVFLKKFDSLFGTHQKIDRVARRNLRRLAPEQAFPSARQIIKFEGINGPDGMKRKAGGADVPQHFYVPDDPSSVDLLTAIETHHASMIKALKQRDSVRASFEAAWLAHAIVDGLTPAHQVPYEQELQRLRGGRSQESRVTVKDKLWMPGETMRQQIANNWRLWGDNGLLAAHLAFEIGIAITSLPRRFSISQPSSHHLREACDKEVRTIFEEAAQTVAALNLYDHFCSTGWTPTLSRKIRTELMPVIIRTVTMAWYAGLQAAERA